MSYRFGFDIGGTFTDLFAINEETGELIHEKVSTTPEDYSVGATEGIERLFSDAPVEREEINHVSHGTTVATNALIEQTGVPTGLITTEGFRDIIAIGRETREELYDLSPDKTPTFTERKHRLGIHERISADGDIVTPLDEESAKDAVDSLSESDVESVAVSLLHSYQNDSHERRVQDIIDNRTNLDVSLSSEVMAEIKEYERTLSTVLNAYLSPLVKKYLARLETNLAEMGLHQTLYLMQANGGVMTADDIEGRVLQLINSGPAAGVLGAKHQAELVGFDNIITLDIGGTSADACIVYDGEISTTTNGEIDKIPLLFPQVDVRTLGSGGGSIAWIDRAGGLNVGPRSAGSDPGPACYGRGGTEPTVTDAALLLGYLDPGNFLGGEMEIDGQAAEDAIESLGNELDEDNIYDLASGIFDITTTNFRRAIRLVTVEKGYDPREFTLTCYGGAGPLFVSRVARVLDLDTAFIPPTPSVLSSFGLSTAEKRLDFSQSRPGELSEFEIDEILDIYEYLDNRASEYLRIEDADLNRTVDMRYAGQTSTINIPLPSLDDPNVVETTRDRFHEQYEDIYGYSKKEDPVEVVTWRLRVTDPFERLEIRKKQGSSLDNARTGHRDVYLNDRFQQFEVYDRSRLPADETLSGPALIEEPDTTIVAEPGTEVLVDEYGGLILSL